MSCDLTFLQAQVRNGFYVPAMIKRAWAVELDVLAEVDRICKKENIRYFADWGTMLGAVRHGGFVPWDDDLDIVMLRKDYENFIKLAPKSFKEGFEIYTYKNHKDYWQYMARVVGKNRICFEEDYLESHYGFPYIAGIDITVLDNVPISQEAMDNMGKLAKDILLLADLHAAAKIDKGEFDARVSAVKRALNKEELFPGSGWIEDRDERIIVLKNILSEISYDSDRDICRRRFYSLAEELFSLYYDEESDRLTQMMPMGINGSGRAYPKYYYSKTVYMPFENTTIPLPAIYDEILKTEYGFYMNLVKSSGAHDYPFYEKQKKELEEKMGFKVPGYEFSESLLEAVDKDDRESYRKKLSLLISEMDKVREKVFELFLTDERNELLAFFVQAQEIAIEIGNLLESVKGEGTQLVSVLEQLCEKIYINYQKIETGTEGLVADKEELGECWNLVHELIDKEIKKRIVLFLSFGDKEWKYLESYYYKEKEDSNADVYRITPSYYYKDYLGQAVKKVNEGEDIDISVLCPDRIYIQFSYDGVNESITVDNNYYSRVLKKYTDELIYVPYFRVEDFEKNNFREYKNMESYACVPAIFYADKIILNSETLRERYVEKLEDFAGSKNKSVWEGKIVVESEATDKSLYEKDKKLLYYISASTVLFYKEKMIEKIEDCYKIFEANKGKIQIYAIVDKNIESLLEDYPDLLEEIKRLEKIFAATDFIRLINDDDLETIESCCAYYGDPSPLLLRFRDAGKAVMVGTVLLS